MLEYVRLFWINYRNDLYLSNLKYPLKKIGDNFPKPHHHLLRDVAVLGVLSASEEIIHIIHVNNPTLW